MLSGLKLYNAFKNEIDFKRAKEKLLGSERYLCDYVTDKAFDLDIKSNCLEIDLSDLGEKKILRLEDLAGRKNRNSVLYNNGVLLVNTPNYVFRKEVHEQLSIDCTDRVNSLIVNSNSFTLSNGCTLQEFSNNGTLEHSKSIVLSRARCKIDNCFNNKHFNLVRLTNFSSNCEIVNSFNHCKIDRLIIEGVTIGSEIDVDTCFRCTSANDISIIGDTVETAILENRLNYMRGKSYV